MTKAEENYEQALRARDACAWERERWIAEKVAEARKAIEREADDRFSTLPALEQKCKDAKAVLDAEKAREGERKIAEAKQQIRDLGYEGVVFAEYVSRYGNPERPSGKHGRLEAWGPESQQPENDWRRREPGTITMRILKKDGSPSARYDHRFSLADIGYTWKAVEEVSKEPGLLLKPRTAATAPASTAP